MRGAAEIAAALTIAGIGLLAATAQQIAHTGPEAIVWGGVAALPVVAGVVQVLKSAGLVPDRFAGVAALVLGIVGGVVFGHVAGVNLATGIVQGIVVGLAASGAWSTSRHALGISERRAESGGGEA